MSTEFSAINTLWMLLGAILVFFMQAGFSMVASGMIRAKNSGNITIKNLLNVGLCTCFFWLAGFGLLFGTGSGFIGWFDFAVSRDYSAVLPAGIPLSAFFIFQTMLCATAGTIISGAMAERTRFIPSCIFSAVLSLIIYPIAGHWIWGGGWLSRLGFLDFAGSAAIHVLGGTAALAGAIIVGPRIGKYDSNGKSQAIPGRNLTLSALGVFTLWFGWLGLTGCSAGSMGNESISLAADIIVNTTLAAAFSTCTVMIMTKIRYGKSDISMTLNGSLAGLVAISAGCAYVEPLGAVVIGILSGLLLVPVLELIDGKLKVDDPVGAIAVHAVCGAFGTILLGFFSQNGGLLYGGGLHLLGIQCLGVLAVVAWSGIVSSLAFILLKETIGLRISPKEEAVGLDAAEHGLFNQQTDFLSMLNDGVSPVPVTGSVPLEEAVPVSAFTEIDSSDKKLTKVEIIMKQERFEALKHALTKLGITGMTVTQVFGCGTQKGQTETEMYRGVEMDIQLLPKICVEVVVAKIPVVDLINTARQVLYTGHIGDGKIFIYDVENAVKIRTGETGYDAMQGADE